MTDQSNLRFGVTTRENSNIKRYPLLDFGAACFLLLRMRQADKTLHDLHWLDKAERLLKNEQEQCIRKSYLDYTFKIFYKEISKHSEHKDELPEYDATDYWQKKDHSAFVQSAILSKHNQIIIMRLKNQTLSVFSLQTVNNHIDFVHIPIEQHKKSQKKSRTLTIQEQVQIILASFEDVYIFVEYYHTYYEFTDIINYWKALFSAQAKERFVGALLSYNYDCDATTAIYPANKDFIVWNHALEHSIFNDIDCSWEGFCNDPSIEKVTFIFMPSVGWSCT
jgi:hypothetical protein